MQITPRYPERLEMALERWAVFDTMCLENGGFCMDATLPASVPAGVAINGNNIHRKNAAMKLFHAPATALFLAAVSIPLFAQIEPPITPLGKIELFDGKSFAGWAFVSKNTNMPADAIWSVTNGMIQCLGKPYGYARTVQTYEDYQLHAEWRYPVAAGNSGVFLHINPPDKVWPYCYEAQLLTGDAGEVRMNGGSSANGTTPAHPRWIPRQQPSSEKPIGEWNTYDITCRGNTIIVRVNGVLQNTITGTSTNSGTIGLQAEGQLIQFRNLYIEPLPAN